MTTETLADRIITYCDALAAFSLVNAFAFLITLSDPDIRCSIAGISGFVIAANLAFPVLITTGLVLLRRFERTLRVASSVEARVDRFWSHVQTVRIGLVWVVAMLVTFGVWAASQDTTCARGALGS